MLRAFLLAAARVEPKRFRPLATLLEEARGVLGKRTPDPEDDARLGAFLLEAASQGKVPLALGQRPDTD